MKNIEVNNNHKNKYGKLKTILSIWYFKLNRFLDKRIIKHKAILCSNGVIKQWIVNYWQTYDPVVNWIILKSLLAIENIHPLPSRSIDFALAFPQAELDVDVFTELPLVMGVDEKRG